MAALFHAGPYGSFIEIKSNLRRKELNRINHKAPIFFKAILTIETMLQPQSNFEEKEYP